jgi:hypothetical protein
VMDCHEEACVEDLERLGQIVVDTLRDAPAHARTALAAADVAPAA